MALNKQPIQKCLIYSAFRACIYILQRGIDNFGTFSSKSSTAKQPIERKFAIWFAIIARKGEMLRYGAIFIFVIISSANRNNVKIKLFPKPVGRKAKTCLPRSKSLTAIS